MAEGLRSIVVESQCFRWRFDERLVVIPGDRSGPQLYVEWGWRDSCEPEGPGAEPWVVTPAFVADAIREGLRLGWAPAERGVPVRLWFDGTRFERAG